MGINFYTRNGQTRFRRCAPTSRPLRFNSTSSRYRHKYTLEIYVEGISPLSPLRLYFCDYPRNCTLIRTLCALFALKTHGLNVIPMSCYFRTAEGNKLPFGIRFRRGVLLRWGGRVCICWRRVARCRGGRSSGQCLHRFLSIR